MRIEVKIMLVMFILCLGVALSCGGGNVDQLAEVKEKAEAASKAVSGDVISTAEKAGKQEEGEEEIISPTSREEGEEEEGGGSPFPTERPPTPPVEPIEGPVTVEALAYPHYNLLTGKYEKPKVGDVSSYTSMTDDPFLIVMGYYDQLLQGRQYSSRNNLGDAGGQMYAEYAVEDGDHVFTINVSSTDLSSVTSITITKS